jgi:hypothetical protein
MPRTGKEIIAKMKSVEADDFFGFIRNDLVLYLSFKDAKQFLKPETTEKQWIPQKKDRESILLEMLKYMDFAWEKAINCRGLSAGRTMDHYTAWVWMLKDEEEIGNLQLYEFYGKDNLVKICKKYGWDPARWDDGIRTNGEGE